MMMTLLLPLLLLLLLLMMMMTLLLPLLLLMMMMRRRRRRMRMPCPCCACWALCARSMRLALLLRACPRMAPSRTQPWCPAACTRATRTLPTACARSHMLPVSCTHARQERHALLHCPACTTPRRHHGHRHAEPRLRTHLLRGPCHRRARRPGLLTRSPACPCAWLNAVSNFGRLGCVYVCVPKRVCVHVCVCACACVCSVGVSLLHSQH